MRSKVFPSCLLCDQSVPCLYEYMSLNLILEALMPYDLSLHILQPTLCQQSQFHILKLEQSFCGAENYHGELRS
jgi:hypothetical protein